MPLLNELFRSYFVEKKRIKNPNDSLNAKEKDALVHEMEKETHSGIKDELLRQRDFLSKKITTVVKLNKQIEGDRDDMIIKVQNENTCLIRECNTLREEKQKLKDHFSNVTKALNIIKKERRGEKLEPEEELEVVNDGSKT